jgi:hypothetical protein
MVSRILPQPRKVIVVLAAVAALTMLSSPGHEPLSMSTEASGNSSGQEAQEPRLSSPDYDSRVIEGWAVLVNKRFLADEPELASRALELLRDHIYHVIQKLPMLAVEKLRTVPIWVEERLPHNPCMVYHPDARWLEEHGIRPEKARCVEITNVRNFLEWSLEQPWMLLHELAHAYHHQFLENGFENAEVNAAFEHAIARGLYKSVLKVSGQEMKAYAASNPREYFAEATEAFFGTNDYYPFVRPELQRYDREAFDLLERLWHGAR